ncbi:MAG: hypothetical protein KC591_12310 [Gemmatimonadetes bacterium]|nr:hypothetical protein [Gemmatimonadota bacterium]
MLAWSLALVGDLESSRRKPHRAELAQKIEAVLGAVNVEQESSLLAGLETTKGLDEISAVLSRATPVFDIITRINLALWPDRFRFALADGALDLGEPGDPASRYDGPAFHRAAEALARARREKRPLALAIEAADPAACRVVEEACRLHHETLRDWTDAAHEAATLARTDNAGESPTQQEIARALGVTQPAISTRLRQARHSELLAAEEAIRGWLAGIKP